MKNTIKSLKDIIYKLLYVLTPQQKRIGILVLIASIIGAALETLGVSAILPLINTLLTPEVILENEFLGNILRLMNITENRDIILVFGLGIVMLYLLKNIYFIFLTWARSKYSYKVRRELAVSMMSNYMKKGYRFFLTQNTSELLRGVSIDTNAVYSMLNQILKNLVDCLTIFLICIYILMTDWVMAASIIVLAGICLLTIYLFSKSKMRQMGLESRKYNAIVNQHAIQAFQGIKEVIVMRKQKYFVNQYNEASVKHQQALITNAVAAETPTYIIEAICISGLLGIICVRVGLGGESAVSMLPALSSFAVGAFRILPSLGKISSGINSIIFLIPSLNEMYEHYSDIKNNEENYSLEMKDTGFKKFDKELLVNNISFKYDEAADNVLDNINLVVKKGESIALIGQSGAGKTTLADIMLGLIKPQEGKVTIDGTDIFTIGTEWNKIMGYVPQSVYITDDTIRKNIAFGVADKDIDDEKVWKALEMAQLKDFVQSLDQQLDTMVGERGVRFSGGQRQRVAIARALYEEPDILILDEATAALDNETEGAVMEAIENLQGRITLIIVAHRLTTVRKCDKIYEVREGNIFERDKTEVLANINA